MDGVIAEAKDVARAASQGGENVSQTVAAMQRIEVKAVESASQVRLLDRKGEQIGSIVKSIRDLTDRVKVLAESKPEYNASGTVNTPASRIDPATLPQGELATLIKSLEKEMREAAKVLEFEKAASLRDQLVELRGLQVQEKLAA